MTRHHNQAVLLRALPLGILIAASLSHGAVAEQYKELYFKGREAERRGHSKEAVQYFSRAIELNPREGETVRWYGTHIEYYLPHYHLGVSLSRVGRIESYGEALRAWDESERQGAIQNDKKLYRNLGKLRRKLKNELLPREIDQVQRELDDTQARLNNWRNAAAAIDGDSLQRTETLIAEARRRVDLARASDGFRTAQLARDAVRESWSFLDGKMEALKGIDVPRASTARGAYDRAAARIRNGGCQRTVIDELRLVASEPFIATPTRGSPAVPLLHLAEAHLACGEIDLAAEYLEAAGHGIEANTSNYTSIRSAVTAAVARSDSDEISERATSLLTAGHCGAAILLLAHRPADKGLALIRARAHAQCGETDRAIQLLSEAQRDAGTSPDELKATRDAVDHGRGNVSATDRETRLREQYARAAGFLTQPGCHREAIDALLDDVQSEWRPKQEASPALLLARAYLACGELREARAYSDRAEPEAEADNPVLAALQDDIANAELRRSESIAFEQAVSTYLTARAIASVGGCSEDGVAQLEQAIPTLESDHGQLSELIPGRYTPHLLLATCSRYCGDRDLARKELELAAAEHPRSTQVSQIEAWLRTTLPLEIYSGSYALLVGAAHYPLGGFFKSLPRVEEDLRTMRSVLKAHGFDVDVVSDPTSDQLKAALDSFFLKTRARESRSRLVFYFAGHGWTEANHCTPLGYIVPVDTPSPPEEIVAQAEAGAGAPCDRNHVLRVPENLDYRYMDYMVSMEEFSRYATEIRANHALFLFDSCFSGTVFDATRSQMGVVGRTEAASRAVLDRPVRLFITAGERDQQVPAESVFTPAVARALSGAADTNADGLILGTEVGSYVEVQAGGGGNFPRWGLYDDPAFAGGDVAFRTPESGATPLASVAERSARLNREIAFWRFAFESRRSSALRSYLGIYPEGTFQQLAERILAREAQ